LNILRHRRALITLASAIILVGTALAVATLGGSSTALTPADKLLQREFSPNSPGTENGGSGGEAAESLTAATQFSEARTAPGIVAPGAYSSAYAQLTGLATAGGSWSNVTAVKYDADDPTYRDWYSNSSGGAGLVTGRIVGLASDNAGNVYAAGAAGGVWRSKTGGGNWSPIADQLPSLSSGDLELGPDGALWYATGESNTGGTSYVGSGVYRLANPTSGTFSPSNRVGGNELESTTISSLRFANGRVWAATLRGVWYHSLSNLSEPWVLAYAPNPGYLPKDLQAYSKTQTGFGTISLDGNAAYKNIVNDLVVDPRNSSHVLAAIGWRSGDTYNGFYESFDNGVSWTKINPTGGIDASDIGTVEFAFSSNGDKLYVMNQSPRKLNTFAFPQTYLDGVYVSNTGALIGPWTRIATSDKLGAPSTGSALFANAGLGYSPGIQSWYNTFLLVDPNDANHVFLGLEEVYETKDGGNHWSTIGPYWNFYFRCWRVDSLYAPNGSKGCPQTTHSDQHAVAIGNSGGQTFLYVGNDGGIYKRPLNGQVNASGNATDWQSLNDGTIDALQYYAVDVGLAKSGIPQNPAGTGAIVSGGLQDNGGSIFRVGGAKMSSNFGGDGGDVLVDPNNGCNIVQEYVVLSMRVTQTCANPGGLDAFLDFSKRTTFNIAPPDVNARFIAPFTADAKNIDRWIAGGNSLWFQKKGFAIRSGAEWQKVYTFGPAARVATAIDYSGTTAVAGWCGPCNNAPFVRGVAYGEYNEATGAWTWKESALTGVPNRYVGGVAVDPNNDDHVFIVLNGFSRRFTEGPGNGLGHVFESNDGGATWKDASGNFPDIPANSIKVLQNGALVAGTDLAVLYRPAGSTTWQRLGGNLPLTVALDVELGPDGFIYAATHGRGIWRIATP
jgi:hypothetical protein